MNILQTKFGGREAYIISRTEQIIDADNEFTTNITPEFIAIIKSGHKMPSGEPLWMLVYEHIDGNNGIDTNYPMTLQKIESVLNLKLNIQ